MLLRITLSRIVLLTLAVATVGYNASAADLKPTELKGKSSKLPVEVLQNRFFLKTYRPEFGLLIGTFLNESYTKTSTTGGRVGLFFSEWLGAEFQYSKTAVEDTADRRALNRLKYRELKSEKVVSPDPETNPIYSVMDLNAVVAPFYGKLNLLNRYIVYSDLYLSAGVAKVETRQADKTALVLGAGQRFYLFESWSVRLDVRNRTYTEQRNGSSARKNALSIDFGASYFFL